MHLCNLCGKPLSKKRNWFNLIWAIPHFLSLSTSVSSVGLRPQLVSIPSAWWTAHTPSPSGALASFKQEMQLSTKSQGNCFCCCFFPPRKSIKCKREWMSFNFWVGFSFQAQVKVMTESASYSHEIIILKLMSFV